MPRSKKRRTALSSQRVMSFGQWGGWRPGAGRPVVTNRRKTVPHRSRPRLSKHVPVHVTLKLRRDLPGLRNKDRFRVIKRAFVKGCSMAGFGIIDWSVQHNHLHLIVEADDQHWLGEGMRRFNIRLARGLNLLLNRKGPVLAERYYQRPLKTPAEVRNARAYVINNARRHAAQRGRRHDNAWVDPYSSWAWFDGWRDCTRTRQRTGRQPDEPAPVAQPKRWLLRVGWRQRGLVAVNEVPAQI